MALRRHRTQGVRSAQIVNAIAPLIGQSRGVRGNALVNFGRELHVGPMLAFDQISAVTASSDSQQTLWWQSAVTRDFSRPYVADSLDQDC